MARRLTRKRGAIYFADIGLVEHKRVLIVSWNVVNEVMGQPIVALVTSRDRPRSLETYVELDPGEGGVREPSYVLCHFLVTVPETRIDPQPIGELLSPWKLLEVEQKIVRALDLHL